MASNSDHLKALLHSYIDKDKERLLSIFLQVAAREAKKGHESLAKDLRDLVEQARKPNINDLTISLPKDIKNLDDLFVTNYPKLKFNNLIVNDRIKNQLNRIVLEQRNAITLRNHGLSPRRKILLAGPPGTGKTLTASVLAGELGLPLFQIRMESIITKYMGESSVKLSQVFEVINKIQGVYFFDEFDALGSQRSAQNDVGEARRILNSFLQMIEKDQSSNLIICATNHIEILDYALFRRFDDIIYYELPTNDEIITLFRNRLQPYVNKNFSWGKLAEKTEGFNNSDITRIADDTIKMMILTEKEKITLSMIEKSIEERYYINQNLNN